MPPGKRCPIRASTCSLSASLRTSLGELGGEGVEDHLLRRSLFDTARAQIEQLFFINAPDGRPVAAFTSSA
ncbi:hypothetical protein LNP25_27025 [Klebsiella variicola subsp. variicola]|nr:hypothetical protein [Klebsiella variicola subsp. variicola]